MKIDVAFLPKDMVDRELSDTVCIILDIFRATTSIVTGIHNGCHKIIPVLSVEEAQVVGSELEAVLFAGERQSIRLPGYDLGNSPFEFSAEAVKDRTIVMTTTNGTVAIQAAQKAYQTLIGAFINASAVCLKAKEYEKDILIVCAGTDGLFSLEDALCAGLLVQLLSHDGESSMTDSARGAWLMYTGAKEQLVAVAVDSRNGQRLYEIDHMADVEYCLEIDKLSVVPQFVAGELR